MVQQLGPQGLCIAPAISFPNLLLNQSTRVLVKVANQETDAPYANHNLLCQDSWLLCCLALGQVGPGA